MFELFQIMAGINSTFIREALVQIICSVNRIWEKRTERERAEIDGSHSILKRDRKDLWGTIASFNKITTRSVHFSSNKIEPNPSANSVVHFRCFSDTFLDTLGLLRSRIECAIVIHTLTYTPLSTPNSVH